MIIIEARKHAQVSGINNFKGTSSWLMSSWCHRFMKRHEPCMRITTRIAQKIPSEYEQKISDFHKFII